MPQARQELRDKFLNSTVELSDDGIDRCEKIIRENGGRVENGIIYDTDVLPFKDEATRVDYYDAIEYLCTEWDYGFENL